MRTIVIFDRIREELKTKSKAEDLKDLVNRCITQTLTRTLYTNHYDIYHGCCTLYPWCQLHQRICSYL